MCAERVAVCFARLQPLQHRHLALLAPLLADYSLVMVVCGGVTQSLSVLNPWSVAERRAMLELALGAHPRLQFVPVADCWYDDARWAGAVRESVAERCAAAGVNLAHAQLDCLGLERKGADYYAALFPDWQAIVAAAAAPAFDPTLNEALLSASQAQREALLEAKLPAPVRPLLETTLEDTTRGELREEFAFIAQYREAWLSAPFPPIFVTVDALVLHGDRVLLVRRGRRPGRGLLALPGGFIDPAESLLDSALRELHEETGLSLTAAACRACQVFDYPARSLRGRTITHLHQFALSATAACPTVVAGDDAAEALWLPLAALRPADFFEDHYALLQLVLGLP